MVEDDEPEGRARLGGGDAARAKRAKSSAVMESAETSSPMKRTVLLFLLFTRLASCDATDPDADEASIGGGGIAVETDAVSIDEDAMEPIGVSLRLPPPSRVVANREAIGRGRIAGTGGGLGDRGAAAAASFCRSDLDFPERNLRKVGRFFTAAGADW